MTQYPKKRDDMLKLSDRMSTPQVFFNTRHVGGADETIALLKKWDNDKERYKSALERYQDEIEKYADPSNPRFSVPDYAPVIVEPSPPRGDDQYSVALPNGKVSTVLEVVEMLKKIVPGCSNVFKMKVYKKSFVGIRGVEAAMAHFKTDEATAVKFLEQLVQKQILHHVAGKKACIASGNLYRLQCNEAPDVLNAYRIWTERVDQDSMRLVTSLKDLFSQIEGAVTDDCGKIDLIAGTKHKLYAPFEEAVCELQGVDIATMDDDAKTVSNCYLLEFGLNYC